MPATQRADVAGMMVWNSVLEVKLHSKLDVSRITRARDDTKRAVGLNEPSWETCRRGRVWPKFSGRSRIQILRMIKEIEELKPELKVLRF